MGPIFEQSLRAAPGEAVEEAAIVGAEPGEGGQVMGPGEDVDAVDLVELEPLQQPEQMASADRAGRARLGKALCGERDPTGGGEPERVPAPGAGAVANVRHLAHEANAEGRGKMTTISIFGADGRMAQAIVAALDERDDARIGEHRPDVYVDFTVPDAIDEHLACALKHCKPILIGTTGLTADHQRAIDEAARHVAVLQSANTSLGVNLLAHLVREAAQKLGEEWDVEIVEMHHR